MGKTAISIPDELFKEADRAAKRLGISRSELYAKALGEFLGIRRGIAVTASYDAAFGDSGADDLADFRRTAARKVLSEIEWSED